MAGGQQGDGLDGGVTRLADGAAATDPITLDWPRSAMSIVSLCPNCGGVGPCGVVLMARTAFPGRSSMTKLLRCASCTCLFFDPPPALDYGAETDVQGAALAFYIQQAAGIAYLVQSLARVNLPAGTRLLDVGCGFGFGLDYAIRARGWSGTGIDPAPLARAGAMQLDLPIAHRLLEPADGATPADVVMAAEVLEHVDMPGNFLAQLRTVLGPRGMLILSTPNAESVRRDAPDSTLIPILSVGAHTVLQTRRSLAALLAQAGFGHVVVRDAGFSLIAYASAAPFTLQQDESVLHAAYRDYLHQRATLSAPGSDLALGFAARALQEALHDHDWDEVDRQFALLEPAIADRFGIALGSQDWRARLGAIRSPIEWVQAAPFCLPSLLQAKATQALFQAEDIDNAVSLFAAARQVAGLLRPVLREMNADDQAVQAVENFDVGGLARAAIVGAVNRGDLAVAHGLVRDLPDQMAEPPEGPLDEAGRDLVFALAMLDLDTPGALDRAARRFARVRDAASADPTGALYLAAVQGGLQATASAGDRAAVDQLYAMLDELPARSGWPAELRRMHEMHARSVLVRAMNAGRLAEARDVLAQLPAGDLEPPVGATATDEQRDVLFAAAMLDLQPGGDGARAARYFARVREGRPGADALCQAALQGELQVADLARDRAALKRLHGVVAALDPASLSPELRRVHALYQTRGPFGRLRRAFAALSADAPMSRPPD